ncbi:MAG: peptidylprolyl isomerase [Paracoccus sp. (in: a-proteobacteria)]|nr:peptidylprolyl isomerase [Paracoccus sp. (in: a-proteobacteria)]
MHIRPALAMLLLLSAPVSPALAQDADTVVATVNGTGITLGEMAAMKLDLPPNVTQMPAPELWDLLLDQLIRQAAIARIGEDNITPRDEAAIALDRRAYLAGAALERIADFAPSDEELRAAYDRLFPADDPVREYSAQHILLETQEAAQAVIDELADGADFAKLAEERSIDTASGLNGGDLGWFTLDRVVSEFGNAVATMEADATSAAPVQSQFGWHVIKLNESRDQVPPSFEDMHEQLIQIARRDKVEAEIERITTEAEVQRTEDIDPAVLEQDILGIE